MPRNRVDAPIKINITIPVLDNTTPVPECRQAKINITRKIPKRIRVLIVIS